MYSYTWDPETGGYLMNSTPLSFSNEPRPVYYKELDLLGFDQFWNYEKDYTYPYMWAESNKYWYRGRKVAETKGGSLYHAPEIKILEEPEPDNMPLKFIDITEMVRRNHDFMAGFEQETIRKVYNTWLQYRKKVDVFHVSYSGGKDSEVMLDIVQKALPHDAFHVIFGDTLMEFPDTYDAVREEQKHCLALGIDFNIAHTHFLPEESWRLFGPPSTNLRWCCSVHKTSAQLLKLREIAGKSDFREMAFVGVRGDESVRRSGYDYISLGTKHKGQYSCNPILNWNSAEVFLYIYENNLYLNKTYKKGNSRAGCMVCPMSGDKSDFFRQKCYPQEVKKYVDLVREMSTRELATEEDNKRFIETGGWKMRTNGRDIKSVVTGYSEVQDGLNWEIKVPSPKTDWHEWIKTAGIFTPYDNHYTLQNGGTSIDFKLFEIDKGYKVMIPVCKKPKEILLVKMLKQVFRKSAYCHLCRECEADCQHGYISMADGKLSISDDCKHCGNCHKASEGCLMYACLEKPKGTGRMNNKSIDSYADHAPKLEWIEQLFDLGDDFFTSSDNHLGSEQINKFNRFLRDACIADKNALTETGKRCAQMGTYDPAMWGILLTNLSYSPEVGWYIMNIKPYREYTKQELIEKLLQDGVKERGARSITGAYKKILALPFGNDCGLGTTVEETVDGKKTFNIVRSTWDLADPRVIIYSLYKFADACEGYYNFRLSYLMDETEERAGISPSQIFGLDEQTMQQLLEGLSINYPNLIHAAFNLDLDSISLLEHRADGESSQEYMERILGLIFD